MKFFLITFSFLFIIGCKKNENIVSTNETILKGKTSIFVDESVFPIVEDEVLVFESRYPAKISIATASENEILQALFKQQRRIAILARPLNQKEISFFKNKKITPKVTPFAQDAIVLIMNNKQNDSLVDLSEIQLFMQGKHESKIKGLVFDNLNSSVYRQLTETVKVNGVQNKNVYSFKTNTEVLQFVAENEGMIGVLGYNWLQQPTTEVEPYLKNIHTLKVKDFNGNEYFEATQNNFAEKKYPLMRTLYIVNCQGYSGLGMGFASFIAGEVGQRIILKSGLLPVHLPGRKIAIRNTIENNKN